jgi:hypothetical protein
MEWALYSLALPSLCSSEVGDGSRDLSTLTKRLRVACFGPSFHPSEVWKRSGMKGGGSEVVVLSKCSCSLLKSGWEGALKVGIEKRKGRPSFPVATSQTWALLSLLVRRACLACLKRSPLTTALTTTAAASASLSAKSR